MKGISFISVTMNLATSLASTPALGLSDRLKQCATLWAEAHDATLARLGRAAINDSSFFTREDRPQGVTTGTLERFARFLGEPGNWPDGVVPEAVLAFVHVVGVRPEAAAPATGLASDLSGQVEAGA